MLDAAARDAVLRTAAASITSALGLAEAEPPEADTLQVDLAEPRATFVTLRIDGELRGCCGSLEPTQPLLLDVWRNARASAFRDLRFPPLTADEWPLTRIEVSVLTPCEPLPVASETELVARLVPHRDGIVLSWRGQRATFLPKVWDLVSGPREFLALLKDKAGLSPHFWAPDVEVSRYRTETVAGEPHAATTRDA
jgi:AmmeMemoRadiSam system protein A